MKCFQTSRYRLRASLSDRKIFFFFVFVDIFVSIVIDFLRFNSFSFFLTFIHILVSIVNDFLRFNSFSFLFRSLGIDCKRNCTKTIASCSKANPAAFVWAFGTSKMKISEIILARQKTIWEKRELTFRFQVSIWQLSTYF